MDTKVGDSRPSRRIVYLAPDCTDCGTRKRAYGFLELGHDVISFSFRRTRYDADFVPDWPNVELGKTTERKLFTRIWVFWKALWVIYVNRRRWQDASMVCVRNLDLALLSLVARVITRFRAPLVYEVIDVHPILTRSGALGATARWLERRVLKRCELLIVTSPAFLTNYFQPIQGYQGPAFLLENKWPSKTVASHERPLKYDLVGEKPLWTIGWFGNLRCQKSLEILTELADALPDRVRIYMRGCASLIGEQLLMDSIRGRENVVYEGEYRGPDEFQAIYSEVHFNWCADFDGSDNSRWLLPNRLYEGGYFGIPAIAIAGYQTGRTVRQRQLGISLDAPFVDNLKELLLRMTREDYQQMRQLIEAKPVSDFVDTGDMARLMRGAPSRSP
jgi:succinoglycan biosynthesis protein ExoL